MLIHTEPSVSDQDRSTMMEQTHLVDIFDTAQLVALIGGVVIPFVVALLAKANASGTVKSLLAFLSAALLALGTYLADADGAHTWKGAVSVFVVALISAAASRVTITGGADTKLQRATGDFGVGAPANDPSAGKGL